jgi:tetratricopeptide (TPR) repeat protein
MRFSDVALAGLGALGLALASAAAARQVEVPMAPSAADVARYEKARDKRPDRAEVRDDLGLAYYRFARGALDRGEYPVYEDYLGRAMKEWLASLRLDPENSAPHTYMGIVSAYQGRIEDALDSFYNARSLEPGAGVYYTNIAETLIYAGGPAREVQTWISRGERMGVSPAIVELNYCLLRWRDGDVEAAGRNFYRALRFDPSVVHVWNEAPVSKPIQTFEDLTQYCCGSPACGPYLASACKTAARDVVQHEVPAETARRELVIEMERRRELERIYKQRRDLEVRVKDAEVAPAEAKPAGEAAPVETKPAAEAQTPEPSAKLQESAP